MLARDLLGKGLYRCPTDREAVQTRGSDTQLHTQRAEDGVRRRETQIDQYLSETPAGAALLLQGDRQLLARDQLPFEQHATECRPGARRRRRRNGDTCPDTSEWRGAKLKCHNKTLSCFGWEERD